MIELSVLSENVIPLEVYMPTGGGITPTGTKSITITENGTYTEDVTSYATAEIDVSVSGGAVNNQNKTVNPSTSQQSVTADAGYTGLGTVTVTAMPSGTEGTPTATKGAVSNHSVSVTPSVTNTAGYISGGTHNGTAVSVSASELVSGTKSVTSNGSGIDVTNYELIDVSVPNSYTSADEGKVVDNGALVSQTSATYTANDTYDTTLIDSVTVNVSGGGDLDAILDGTFSGRLETDATSLKSRVLQNMSNLTELFAPNVVTCADYVTTNDSNLETVVFPVGKTISSSAFRECAKFKALDVYGSTSSSSRGSLSNQCFMNDTLFDTLIIRSTAAYATINNINVFQGTPFASGGTGGTLYVPSALISDYQSASNWSTILGYTNNQIKSIESTHTDPNAPIDLTLYYADGTPIT